MKFLITDPCYITTEAEWDTMGALTEWKLEDLIFPFKIEAGKLITIQGTSCGDGSMQFGDSEIGVDSGTVCIAEVADDYEPKGMFGVTVGTLKEAKIVFRKALEI